MAERVVDLLEVVEVEERDDGGLAGGQGLGDPLLEQRAVREPGERVLEREPLQFAVAHAAAAGAVEQRQQRGQADDPSSITMIVPIQDIRSLRVGELVVVVGGARAGRGGCGRSRRARRALRRARSRAPASARTPLRSAAGTRRRGADLGGAVALARGEAVELRPACRFSSSRQLGLDAERYAALGVGLGLERVDAVRVRPRARPAPRSAAALVGAQVQRGDAGARREATSATTAAIKRVRLPSISPGWSARGRRS